jgi:hypothetical protein
MKHFGFALFMACVLLALWIESSALQPEQSVGGSIVGVLLGVYIVFASFYLDWVSLAATKVTFGADRLKRVATGALGVFLIVVSISTFGK